MLIYADSRKFCSVATDLYHPAPDLGLSELPSVSLTSVSSAHFLRVSGSPLLFVKRWTSLALWQIAVSPPGERDKRRERASEEGDNSFTLRTKRSGNHPGERSARQKGEAEGGGGMVQSCETNRLQSTHAQDKHSEIS